MARFTKESLDELRVRVQLDEVLSQHIQLKRAGSGFKALCPFHDEKTPSFVVNKGDTHYHCFGCGAHGDAIGFLMQHLKMSFHDAVVQLAERFQVHLDLVQGDKEEKAVPRVRLKEVLDAAARYYQAALVYTEEGHEALSYLYRRNIPLEFIHTFRLGFAPKERGALRSYLHQLGFQESEMLDAGLLNERRGEFFFDRITFPILDVAGSVIGFSCRKFRESTTGGKYINSRETALFKKSKVLFGMHQSRRRIVKQKQAIIVEGALDALQMIYHGFDLTVAALGTAFGQEHVGELVQLGVSRVFLLFDGDTAGRTAAIKVGHLFQKQAVEVHVVVLESTHDPDSLLAKDGPIPIAKALAKAEDYLSFLYATTVQSISQDSPAEKQRLIKELVQQIREWDNPIMVHESLRKLASIAKVPEELLGVHTQAWPSLYVKRAGSIAKKEEIDPDRIVETDLLRWLILCGFKNKNIYSICETNIRAEDLSLPLIQKLYQHVLDTLKSEKPIDLVQLVQAFPEDDVEGVVAQVLAKKINREKAEAHLLETIKRIKERNWIIERDVLLKKIQSPGLAEEEQLDLAKQFDALNKINQKLSLKSV